MASFAIEAAGEANPLTGETLLKTLQWSLVSDQHKLQTATNQIATWESSPGFYSWLQSIYIDLSLPSDIRFQAVIQLEKVGEKYWGKGKSVVISREEKELIKSRIPDSILNEPSDKHAVKAALLLARIIRIEYPREWPHAIPMLITGLRSEFEKRSSIHRIARYLLIIEHIVMAYENASMQGYKQRIQQVASDMADVLFAVYSGLAEQSLGNLHHGNGDGTGVCEALKAGNIALEALRRLLILGFIEPHRDANVCHIWASLNNILAGMLRVVTEHGLKLSSRPEYLTLLEEQVLAIADVHITIAKERPVSFLLLTGTDQAIEMVLSYWVYVQRLGEKYGSNRSNPLVNGADHDESEDEEITFEERFALSGLLILRHCSKMAFNPTRLTLSYQSDAAKREKKAATQAMKDQLFTVDFAAELMGTTMTKFFVFTPQDLGRWQSEPNEWEFEQEGASNEWETSIRVCAEKLFLDMVINYKAELLPRLITYINDASCLKHDETDAVDGNVFLKDSIYAAVGLAAPVLYDQFDFANFLEETLSREVLIRKLNYSILRRRIALVLGQWLPVKEGLDRPLVYGIIQHLLNKDDDLNDEVVRVTAGRQLCNIVEPFEFIPNDFAPFAPVTLQRLLELIQEVQLVETRIALLNTLHIIVVKMEANIARLGDLILTNLSPLWTRGNRDSELTIRETILAIITSLVESMGPNARQHHAVLMPLIQMCLGSGASDDQEEDYLTEEALNLWCAVLDQTTVPTPQPVIEMFQHVLPMLEGASATVERALNVLEAYIYLIPADMLANAPILLEKLASVLAEVTLKGSTMLAVRNIETLLGNAIILGGTPAVEQLVNGMIMTRFLSVLVDGLERVYRARQITGPKRRRDAEPANQVDYLCIFARIAIGNPTVLRSAFMALRPDYGWLLDEWFHEFDDIGSPVQRKLTCLGLTALLDTEATEVFERLQLYMTVWTSVLTELEEETELDEGVSELPEGVTIKRDGVIIKLDCLLRREDHFQPSVNDTPGTIRSQALARTDPAHTIDTRAFIRQRLSYATLQSGGFNAFRERWLVNVDTHILKAFDELDLINRRCIE